MKTKIFLVAMAMAFISMAATTTSNGFDFIRSHRQGKGATITWAFTTGGATNFCLSRTYDDPADPAAEWTTVCDVPSNNSPSYNHTDENSGACYINYRVVALMSDGSTQTSDVPTIH